MTAAGVVVEGLRKRYDDRAVVGDVSFSVAPGELVAGSSGPRAGNCVLPSRASNSAPTPLSPTLYVAGSRKKDC